MKDSLNCPTTLSGRPGALETGLIREEQPLLNAQSLELGSEKERLRIKVNISCSSQRTLFYFPSFNPT